MDVKDAIGIQIALKKTYEKTSKEISIACEMAAVALEKRDKLNPVSNKYYYFCPNCGSRRSIKQKHNFCHDCGQELDWGENSKD